MTKIHHLLITCRQIQNPKQMNSQASHSTSKIHTYNSSAEVIGTAGKEVIGKAGNEVIGKAGNLLV